MLRIILFITFLAGCTPSNDVEDNVIARVGGQFLTVKQALNEIPAVAIKNDSTQALINYRNDWIQQQLLLQEAKRLRINTSSAVEKRIQEATDDILIQAMRDYLLSQENEKLEVTRQEARNYYQKNKDQFTLKEKYVRYRHITANSMANAQKAKNDLLMAVPWETVVERYSINPSQNLNVSERFWPISMAETDIGILNRYLNIIGINEISPIAQVGNEFHFVQLIEERSVGELPDLEWLISQIEHWLMLEKRRRFYSSYVKNLYLQAQANNEIETYNVTETEKETELMDSTKIISTND